MTRNSSDGLTIVISGSFRKHYDDIREMIKRFEGLGVRVLSPKHSNVVNPGEEFVLLETDSSTSPEEVERDHLAAICRADALYLYNNEGYIGCSGAMEMGWALALGKAVYAKEACKDIALSCFIGQVASPEEVKASLLSKANDATPRLAPQSSLSALQAYVRRVVEERGFDDETARDKVLLMLEEFGELAKALRKYVGLKIDKNKKDHYSELKNELADVFMYLLDLANTCDIDLFAAFEAKERQNAQRRWESA
jgi:NTP pyrophosphatase (non-canonical NTP hydrolase)